MLGLAQAKADCNWLQRLSQGVCRPGPEMPLPSRTGGTPLMVPLVSVGVVMPSLVSEPITVDQHDGYCVLN